MRTHAQGAGHQKFSEKPQEDRRAKDTVADFCQHVISVAYCVTCVVRANHPAFGRQPTQFLMENNRQNVNI